jgi:hypothetical protein
VKVLTTVALSQELLLKRHPTISRQTHDLRNSQSA